MTKASAAVVPTGVPGVVVVVAAAAVKAVGSAIRRATPKPRARAGRSAAVAAAAGHRADVVATRTTIAPVPAAMAIIVAGTGIPADIPRLRAEVGRTASNPPSSSV